MQSSITVDPDYAGMALKRRIAAFLYIVEWNCQGTVIPWAKCSAIQGNMTDNPADEPRPHGPQTTTEAFNLYLSWMRVLSRMDKLPDDDTRRRIYDAMMASVPKPPPPEIAVAQAPPPPPPAPKPSVPPSQARREEYLSFFKPTDREKVEFVLNFMTWPDVPEDIFNDAKRAYEQRMAGLAQDAPPALNDIPHAPETRARTMGRGYARQVLSERGEPDETEGNKLHKRKHASRHDPRAPGERPKGPKR